MRLLVDEGAASRLKELDQRELDLVRAMLEVLRERKEFLEKGMREITGGKPK
jgi:hypothetical protein